MRLLVVDDQSLIREAVRHVMQAFAESVTVLTASDCQGGFAIAERENDLDVLLLDLNLRGLPGVQTITAWRQRHPALPVEVLAPDASVPVRAPDAVSTKGLGLSPRQLEVLELIARSKPNKPLMQRLRALALKATELERASVATNRCRLL